MKQKSQKFYTYRLTTSDGSVAYIGKGSGKRLQNQKRKFQLNGEIADYYTKESDAYKAEKLLIAKEKPFLNKCAGGNGNCVTKTRKTSFEVLYDKIGSKALAARICMNFVHLCDASKVEQIRRVAYG
jgi:hypothetical protein